MPYLADLRTKVLDCYRSWSIQEMKSSGKTKRTMVIRGVLGRAGGRERTAVGRVPAKLGQRKAVNGGSIGERGIFDHQYKRLHNERIDKRHANQPSPE